MTVSLSDTQLLLPILVSRPNPYDRYIEFNYTTSILIISIDFKFDSTYRYFTVHDSDFRISRPITS